MNNKTLDLTRASLIAALYVVLTIIANLAGMASGAIQLRLSEMLIRYTSKTFFKIIAAVGQAIPKSSAVKAQ